MGRLHMHYLLYPGPSNAVCEDIPERARHYLREAIKTKDFPYASCIRSASAVDAMLMFNGYTAGKLFTRIKERKSLNEITPEMATIYDAQKSIEFALALAE